jgi:predicted ArsR family transcriptional regulator
MDQLHVIRHKVLMEGRTQRQVARELGISRVTVRKYLTQAAPVRYEYYSGTVTGRSGHARRTRPRQENVGGRATRRRAGEARRIAPGHAEGDGHAPMFDSFVESDYHRRIAASASASVVGGVPNPRV